jgi:RNA recognition motif-containing protein
MINIPNCSMTKLRIAKDRKTGRSRGFAYLDFDNKENAEVAVAALAGTALHITYNHFKTKTNRNELSTI